MQPRYSVVSFDLDLTLIFHVKSTRQEQVVAMLNTRGYAATVDDYRAALHIAREFYDVLGYQYADDPLLLRFEYVRLILECLGCSDPSILGDVAAFYREYDEEPANFFVPQEARALLTDVRASGRQLVAISSNLMAAQRVAYCGLDRLFVHVLTPVMGCAKPELYRVMLERTQTAPAHIIHVGDDPIRDVLAPRRYGIDAVLFDPRQKHAGLTWPAVVHTYDALRSWIL